MVFVGRTGQNSVTFFFLALFFFFFFLTFFFHVLFVSGRGAGKDWLLL